MTLDSVDKARPKTILIVEDEADLAELLRYNFEREGYACYCATAGSDALATIRKSPPDLVVLDRMLPGLSGDEVLRRIKRDPATARIPVIMLTAKVGEDDELVGFALGAEDYVTKPFSIKVLLARMAARLRRAGRTGDDGQALTIGPVKLDHSRHEVTVGEEPVRLTATEFKLLLTLMDARGRVLDRRRLIEAVLGPTTIVLDRTIDAHITGLRKKLGAAAKWVRTVRGVGYAFRPPT